MKKTKKDFPLATRWLRLCASTAGLRSRNYGPICCQIKKDKDTERERQMDRFQEIRAVWGRRMGGL